MLSWTCDDDDLNWLLLISANFNISPSNEKVLEGEILKLAFLATIFFSLDVRQWLYGYIWQYIVFYAYVIDSKWNMI